MGTSLQHETVHTRQRLAPLRGKWTQVCVIVNASLSCIGGGTMAQWQLAAVVNVALIVFATPPPPSRVSPFRPSISTEPLILESCGPAAVASPSLLMPPRSSRPSQPARRRDTSNWRRSGSGGGSSDHGRTDLDGPRGESSPVCRRPLSHAPPSRARSSLTSDDWFAWSVLFGDRRAAAVRSALSTQLFDCWPPPPPPLLLHSDDCNYDRRRPTSQSTSPPSAPLPIASRVGTSAGLEIGPAGARFTDVDHQPFLSCPVRSAAWPLHLSAATWTAAAGRCSLGDARPLGRVLCSLGFPP